jgi:excisionase family DNA binding protein
LSKKEASKILGVSESMIDKLRTKGLPFHKVGKLVKFDEDEVTAWFKKQK